MPRRKGKRHTKKEHRIQSAVARSKGARNSWAITMSMAPKARGRKKKR